MKIAIIILSILLIIAIYKACLNHVSLLVLVKWIKESNIPLPTEEEIKKHSNTVLKNIWKK
ncbi:MAG: hypothetical protein NC122_07420 [Faecalibacterium sp.]|nr:hypothetical protein [Ruminococcus sp.]MCM1392175.1 hypothetical protein [Ruminococcus sp.]MCM1486021.1 hypothetical protein [Faecalibacterium sp.]